MVGQDAPEGVDHLVAADGAAEHRAHQVDLRAMGRRASGSPGREHPVAGRRPGGPAREVDEEERAPVADEQPRAVVVRRVERAEHRGDRVGCRLVCGRSATGSSPRDRLDGSLSSPSGWFVSPAQTPCSLTASQVPPGARPDRREPAVVPRRAPSPPWKDGRGTRRGWRRRSGVPRRRAAKRRPGDTWDAHPTERRMAAPRGPPSSVRPRPSAHPTQDCGYRSDMRTRGVSRTVGTTETGRRGAPPADAPRSTKHG